MKMRIALAGATCALLLAPEARAADVIDLISPTRCELRFNRLLNCRINPLTLSTPTAETAVPLRTALRSVVSGNCSTQYPLEAKAEAPGAAPVVIPYLRGTEVQLRGPGGAPVGTFTLSDNSTWTPSAVLDGSCLIKLEVRWNEVDVSSAAEAHALIAQIDSAITAAENHAARMEELMLYQKAYSFMHSLADRFRVELSNETMQELRAAALESGPALESMILNCADLSFEERLALLRLHGGLWVLGKPEDWQRPDGTVMTLEDHLGPNAAEILSRLNAIIDRQTENPPDYEQLYEDAVTEVTRLKNKKLLAQAQLAPWLQ
ncbi:hypothetical protein HPC49_22690 [Pyxidicoccus fallax]|uniref:Lipoprotein n=1 Tax=Pyxidicoccus fallax TaxID=394095 RepID=A0A848LRU5_9BACT|nr:hypothetical protein [Pyxidicoccus fallax]NMO20263.1 hypothetical protein [Pyxidicoccus fallax]NPC81021.1 hypothetical protein [Pyxidicoccus fallax]